MNVALHWWQVTYYDGAAEVYRKVTSDECPDSWAIPDMPIIIAIQIGYEAPEILVNGAQWYTKLRVEVRHYECYRPGWWEPRKRLWKERWEEAREDLAAKKAELGID
jgi:hypothetical protein